MQGFRHEAAVYRGDKGFLDVAVDYINDGRAAGESVLVAAIPAKIELLRDALGRAAGEVRFVDMAQVGHNPARIIPMWREAVDARCGAPVRGIGEPVWCGRSGAELAEALLHEALLNVAFGAGSNLLLRCTYDADALGEAILTDVHLRHPAVMECGSVRAGLGYRSASQAAIEFATPLPDLATGLTPEVFQFDQMITVRQLRIMLGERAERLGIDSGRTCDLMLAMHEIAVNSLHHGGGAGTLRLWSDGAALVCEIRDRGYIDQPLVGRIRPTPAQVSGRGVWLANQLCDLVQIRSSAVGTTVRLYMML